eukprot:3178848-Rhodomonas_salina.1
MQMHSSQCRIRALALATTDPNRNRSVLLPSRGVSTLQLGDQLEGFTTPTLLALQESAKRSSHRTGSCEALSPAVDKDQPSMTTGRSKQSEIVLASKN